MQLSWSLRQDVRQFWILYALMFVTQPHLTGLGLHVTVETQPVFTFRYVTPPGSKLTVDCCPTVGTVHR